MKYFDVKAIREQFPELNQKVRGFDLIYFDSAATALKPRVVIESLHHFYAFEAANVHRGAHYLSDLATVKFEAAREKVAHFLNAKDSTEIIFTKGTTESINLVAQSYGRAFLKTGDEILLTELEHHGNIVPWQMLAKEKGLTIKFVPINDNGDIDLETFSSCLSNKTKLVAITHCSNTLGTVLDIKKLTQAAHSVGAKVLIDAAQSVAQMKVDVREIECDFLAFSGHKLFGPYGVGVLYGKQELLNAMPPWQTGGATIDRVQKSGTTFLESPHRFEAGTPNISGVIGLSEAIHFMESLNYDDIKTHEQTLSLACLNILEGQGATVYGKNGNRVNIMSFNLPDKHSADVGQLLDQQGIAVRTGHHCTQILMDRLGISGTVRVSFSVYNTLEEVEKFGQALKKVKEML